MIEDDNEYEARISAQKAAEAFPEDHERALQSEKEAEQLEEEVEAR